MISKYKYYLILLAVGFIAYFNSLFGAFVWDDISQIQQNTLIHSLTNIPSQFLGGTYAPQNGNVGTGTYYRPLMSLAFSVIYAASGAQPFLFHLAQLVIHIINVLFVFILFKRLFKEKIAFMLALVFAIHPLNVESVAYISALGEPLYVFFGMAGLLLFHEKINVRRTILIGVLLLCSLFSKESGILFLIAILSYYIIFLRKKMSLFKSIPLLAITSIIYLLMRFVVAKVYIVNIPDVPMMTASLAQRVFTMPAIFWFYVKTFFFPKDLWIFQEWFIGGFARNFYVPLLIDFLILFTIVLIGIAILRFSKNNFSAFIFFTIWFLVGIVLHLNILPLDFTVADRYFYFAMIGLLGIIGVSLNSIKNLTLKFKIVGTLFAILVITIFSIRTLIRNTNWADGISLYSHDLQYLQNDRIENSLAIELVNAGRYNEASQHFQALLTRNPRESALYVNLAVNYEMEKKLQDAENVYLKGLAIDDSGAVYYNLARMLYQHGEKISQAQEVAKEGLVKFPQNGSLWLIEALSDYKLGDKQNALNEAQKAKDFLPNPTTQKIYDNILNGIPL